MLLALCSSLLLALAAHATGAGWQEEIPPKFVFTQLQEDRSVQRFVANQSHSDHFKLLEQDGDFLLVGARNIVYNLSLHNLTEERRLEWPANPKDIHMCQLKGKTEMECQNYIRVLARKSNDTILVCGTNAFKPMCRQYKELANGTYLQTSEKPGEGLCPYDPNHNSTAIFAGPVKDRTAPSFVNSLHHEDYVYFFFRETAVEYINCGKIIYSRVARVCTKDKGGPHKFQNRWTSFLKARLNCSVPGEFPFYFNEIQSTSHIVEGVYNGGQRAQLVYAVFTTPSNSLSGSAVCAFRLEDILKTFDGHFKGQEDINANWLPVPVSKVPEPRPGQCVNDSRTLPEMTVNFIKDHSLMDQAVPAFWGQPVVLHTSFNYRFTYIAVDAEIETTNKNKYDVLFIGTDKGRVLKAFNAGSATASGGVVPVILEEMVVFPQGWAITNLLVHHSHRTARLIVVSHHEVASVPLHACETMAQSCAQCVALQDPYCAWDLKARVCTSSKSRMWQNTNFVQNVEEGWDKRCPGGNPYGTGSPPQRQPHHQIPTRHDGGGRGLGGTQGSGSLSVLDPGHPGAAGALPGTSKEFSHIYTAETLAIGVTTSIVTALVIGFISGYIFSRRCRNDEVDSPYDESHYLEQRGGAGGRLAMEPSLINHTEGFLPSNPTNKPINLVLNVPPKNGNGKNANSSADNKPIQKVKKIYL
ncbi:smp-2 [Cordylochernes scorpioides]|uniref:Smp-2 n=1 Tax=Cordylochernes scorpioides TaxID=51811 RepID=A0ABY6L3F5_9ARAC|nr:smp-2 [Cordylochernes scorpioides]